MLNNIKALLVVATLGYIVFYFSKEMCLRYMTRQTFVLRRNAWFALTAVAFLSPSFWMYAVFAIGYLTWATKKDPNPLALFALITFVIPNASFYIPTVLVNQLFDLTQYRILGLVVLVPVAKRILSGSTQWASPRLKVGDWALFGFLLIQVLSLAPYESVTNTVRRSFLFLLDTMLLFYVFSRLKGEKRVSEVAICFWLSAAVMSLIAIFERGRGWLLYTGLVDQWGSPNSFAWLLRGEGLRAQAAANHSINLGYTVGIALGLFLYLQDRRRKAFNAVCMFAMLAAIYASGSRAAWVMTALVVVLFLSLRPHAGRRLLPSLLACGCVIGLVYMTPLKEAVFDKLPFIGSADQDTVSYRQQLFTVTWPLILQNPYFGSPFVYSQMESLRQGQGIIDIVNGYIAAALSTGLVGLGFFVTMLATALFTCVAVFLRSRRDGLSESTLLGAGLISIFFSTILFIATAGYGPTAYILAGLLISYASIAANPSLAPIAPRNSMRRSNLRSTIDRAQSRVVGSREP